MGNAKYDAMSLKDLAQAEADIYAQLNEMEKKENEFYQANVVALEAFEEEVNKLFGTEEGEARGYGVLLRNGISLPRFQHDEAKRRHLLDELEALQPAINAALVRELLDAIPGIAINLSGWKEIADQIQAERAKPTKPIPLMFLVADELADLKAQKTKAEEELDRIKAGIDRAEELLTREMLTEETQKFTRKGLTFFLKVERFVSAIAATKDKLLAWLKGNGYIDLVKEQVNAQTLKSLIGEMLDHEEPLPEELASLLNINEKPTVGTCKAFKTEG